MKNLDHITKISNDIYELIGWNKKISNADIKLSVGSNSITVNGKVDSVTKKNALIKLLLAFSDNYLIKNNVTVDNNFHRSDRELCSTIKLLQRRIALSEGEKISVTVSNGVVKLEGCVFEASKKAEAAGFSWEVSGVKDCINEIKVLNLHEKAEASSMASIRAHTWQGLNSGFIYAS